MWNLVSVRLETVFLSVQDRSTDCAKHTIGSETFRTHPMVLLCDEAQVEACFGPFGDTANFDARQVHGLRRTYHRLEIIFDTPDGTPM